MGAKGSEWELCQEIVRQTRAALNSLKQFLQYEKGEVKCIWHQVILLEQLLNNESS